jgi:ribonuclease P protein component
MLKKTERLTRKEFDQFFSTGKRLHSPYLQLIYAPHDTFHGSVVVGKKVAKKAIDRNTLRRRLYAQVYNELRLCTPKGVYILVAKAGLASLSRKAAALEALELLQKVKKMRQLYDI